MGLNWEDACLFPHKNRRTVKTASQQQIRDKIYRGSSVEWKKYKHLLDRFNPEELMVTCLYTRRGGIDINPVRASHEHLLDREFIDCGFCTRG